MGLYRARPGDGVAWVTGASTGIGRALARDLARAGYTVAATARDEDRLETLVDESSGGPGRIIPFPCDVTEEAAMLRTVAAIERDAGPIMLAVFNAGTFFPTRGERFEASNIVKTFEINLFGVAYGMVPVLDHMRARRRGHIVLVGSASAYFGWPSAAAYSASKAALNSLAEGLKHDFDKLNIRIQVVNPGFVDTPLTRKNDFSMPALMQVDDAAKRMAEGIRKGGFEISFPRRLNWPLKLLRMLPFSLRYWTVHKLTKWDKRPLAPARKPRA